jgi:hypothetical protein
MRKALPILLLLTSLNSFAQKTFKLKDLFTEKSIIWYGIDYSRTEFVGVFTNKDLHEYFHGWNRLVVEEPYKYDVSRFLERKSVVYELGYVEKINKESIPNISSISNDSSLRKPDLAAIVSAYQSGHTEGLGMVLIAERYNKPKNFAAHYVVIFDVASKKVLISQKYASQPDGIGLRNYWGHAILDSLRQIAKNYKKWKKKYSE